MVKPMTQVNIYAAKTQLSRLVDRASRGETIVIAKSGTPLAKLVPLTEGKRKKFKYGTLKGKIKIPDDFDAPLPDDVLALFEGSESE